jgi:hypothetical protein
VPGCWLWHRVEQFITLWHLSENAEKFDCLPIDLSFQPLFFLNPRTPIGVSRNFFNATFDWILAIGELHKLLHISLANKLLVVIQDKINTFDT